jgi:hypothetical protein
MTEEKRDTGSFKFKFKWREIMELTGRCYCGDIHYKAEGEPKDFTRSDLDNPVTRQFCPNCGTHLATRPPGFPAVIEKPDMTIFMVDAQPFHQVPEGVATFDRMPG